MTTTNNLQEAAQRTIVAFHIGRGGHFWNPGHLSFIGENKIDKYVDDLFLGYENQSDIWSEIKGRPNLEEKYYAAVEGNEDALAFFANRLKMPFGEKEYFDGGGNHVGLTEEEAESGIGRINIDNDYDTTYTCFLSDCDEKELQLIRNSNEFNWMNNDVQDYIKWMLDEAEEEEEA